jgi:SSS family solute:Na+ symporter
LTLLDTIIFSLYGLLIIFVGNYLSRSKGEKRDSQAYFFAGKTLPWWLVGTSIIAANISAEQFIGMSGSGYAIGLGIATYEWLGAIFILLVAKFFLPVFVKKGIYTMPQFLALRYSDSLKSVLAFFWLALFIFVNLTSIVYLGALALKTIFGIRLIYGIFGLAIFSLLYTIFNGLKAIASTDIIQVFFLMVGGILTTILSINAVSDGEGFLEGCRILYSQAPGKFHMILQKSSPDYTYLPGIRAIFGGIWIAGIYYFGANQYIIQKALGSKDLREAQRGMVFAGFLKLLLPLVVVVPGIVAFVLHADIAKPDEAYPWLLSTFIPSGIRGLVFAALIAAIVSSLSAIINSTSTIFTMDIYKVFIKQDASEDDMVRVGRISGIVAMFIAACTAPLLGTIDQAFQFIQEYTGMISPGIVAIFILGIFWKKTTSNAAFTGVILSIPISVALKFIFSEMPFLDQMVLAFFLTSLLIIIISLLEQKRVAPKYIQLERHWFRTGKVFNILSLVILLILLLLYAVFW